jgi:hypothetical protein
MEKEIKITVENGVKELTILHGNAEPVYHEKGIEVSGASIEAARTYLEKPVIPVSDIWGSKLEFSIEKQFIHLFYSVRRRNPDVIKGSLKLHPDLLKFNINTDKKYNTFELSDFFKMNRHFFENREYAMKLVSELQNFQAKVNKDIELKADNRANSKVLIHQVVESNIPESFYLELPVFVGQKKVRLEIEININAAFECSLISPDLKQLIDEESTRIITAELDAIKVLHPDLKIFEL